VSDRERIDRLVDALDPAELPRTTVLVCNTPREARAGLMRSAGPPPGYCGTCGRPPRVDADESFEDAPTRPDLPRLQPLAMRIGNALAACPESEAEELWRALRALQRCTPETRTALANMIEANATVEAFESRFTHARHAERT
jgi:hypothetical protein